MQSIPMLVDFPVDEIMTNFTGTPDNRPRKFYAGSAVTAGTGIATFYLTRDGTSTGEPLMGNVEGFWSSTYSTDAIGSITDTRDYAKGSNFVQARSYREGGLLVLLGITLIGVPTTPAGVTINFLVWGD